MRNGRAFRLGLAAALMAGASGIAWAHATLLRSDPPAGAHVSTPPRELRLEFSEAVNARTSRIALVAPDSQRFTLAIQGDSSDSRVIIAGTPALSVAGAYRVEWRLVGSDGHAISGKYSFTVDSVRDVQPEESIAQPPQGTALARTSDSLLQASLRFVSSLSLVTIVGSIAFALFVLPAVGTPNADGSATLRAGVERNLRTLSRAAAWLLLVPLLLRLISNGVLLSGSIDTLQYGDLRDLLSGSTFGRGWLLQTGAVIALLLVLRDGTSPRWRRAVPLAMLMALSAAMLGHPASASSVPALSIVVDAAHVLAAGGWAGGILVMSLCAMPPLMKQPPSGRLQMIQATLRSFSSLALSCAAIVVLTGVASGWMQLREPHLLIGSEYGQALLRKVMAVLAIAALGAYHWLIAQPSLNSERSATTLRRSLALDVAFVLAVLILTAILTGTAPPVR